MSLKERQKLLAIVAVTGVAAAILGVAVAGTTVATPATPDILSGEDYKKLLESRGPIAIASAQNNSRVQAELQKAIMNETDVDLLDNQEKVTIKTWGTMDVEGTWESGYKISLSDGQVIEVLVDRKTNMTTSVNVGPREDELRDWNFTDNQKRIISLVVNDQRFKDEFAGKTDGDDYFVGVMRDQGLGDNAFMTILSAIDNSFMFFSIVDQKTGTVEFAGKEFPAEGLDLGDEQLG